jgi:1,4-dihydroxy-2-naphthoate octaprenyltransferase
MDAETQQARSWLWIYVFIIAALALLVLGLWLLVHFIGWFGLLGLIAAAAAIVYCWHRWGPE